MWTFEPPNVLRWSVVTQDGRAGVWSGNISEAVEVGWRTGTAPVVNGVGPTRALDLAELLVWTRATTISERTAVVQGYLGAKWGFNGLLMFSAAVNALPDAAITPLSGVRRTLPPQREGWQRSLCIRCCTVSLPVAPRSRSPPPRRGACRTQWWPPLEPPPFALRVRSPRSPPPSTCRGWATTSR